MVRPASGARQDVVERLVQGHGQTLRVSVVVAAFTNVVRAISRAPARASSSAGAMDRPSRWRSAVTTPLSPPFDVTASAGNGSATVSFLRSARRRRQPGAVVHGDGQPRRHHRHRPGRPHHRDGADQWSELHLRRGRRERERHQPTVVAVECRHPTGAPGPAERPHCQRTGHRRGLGFGHRQQCRGDVGGRRTGHSRVRSPSPSSHAKASSTESSVPTRPSDVCTRHPGAPRLSTIAQWPPTAGMGSPTGRKSLTSAAVARLVPAKTKPKSSSDISAVSPKGTTAPMSRRSRRDAGTGGRNGSNVRWPHYASR